MRIAIIGSGIAGLVACWRLSKHHEVVVYEAEAGIGMDAHSLDVRHGVEVERVDVPLRVFHAGYYPVLSAVYEEAGVESVPVDSSASFSTSEGRLLFRYGNLRVGRSAIPSLTRVGLTNLSVLRTGIQSVQMLFRLSRELNRADVRGGITFGSYLETAPFSPAFVEAFLLPAVAGIATCSYESIRQFPARTVLGYLDSPRTHSMRRVKEGTRDVASRLTASAREIRTSTPVQAVTRDRRSVVVNARGSSESFDHVILATQATRVPGLVDLTRLELEAIRRFRYERSSLVVHSDPRLAPPQRRWWSPVNYILFPEASAPMTTVVLSQLRPTDWTATTVFQTWNPIVRPREDSILAEVAVERALVDSQTSDAVASLRALHAEPDRRVWFCGSYANEAMTLQESAASSAAAVADAIIAQTSSPR